ncbi:hypothetical protein DSM112329_05230 [Paraconexibacter sp. AEG42_29]|uniref:Uncharacterized protein n=1 Tax=Paraconexibacter sp. AEG42_29 TaxID=2997339 RepID=A0AAU7B382_9ACTN
MRRSWVPTLGCAVAVLAGCGPGATPISPGCTEDVAPVIRALERAPAAVTLVDGSRLSECISDGTDEAELLNVGITFSRAAEELRVTAREQEDRAVAVQLGYLIGATRRGAERTAGVMSELQRRVELVGGRLQTEAPDLAADVDRGLAAGEKTG